MTSSPARSAAGTATRAITATCSLVRRRKRGTAASASVGVMPAVGPQPSASPGLVLPLDLAQRLELAGGAAPLARLRLDVLEAHDALLVDHEPGPVVGEPA